MRVYQGSDQSSVFIVNFGLSLIVKDGEAFVDYEGNSAPFKQVLRDGCIEGTHGITNLSYEQLTWLEEQQTWVKAQIEDSK